jgi:glycosyltransferase involved in cell wall biosynthesis
MNSISVVVCTKNEEDYIEQCLKSLVTQEVVPEIIVVDGNSSDRTRQIAAQFTDKVLLDQGGGLSEARNIGWKAASSPIIGFCDADCQPEKEWTKNILALMKPEIIGVSGPLLSYDGDPSTRMNIMIWSDWFPRMAALLGYHNIWGANMSFRKSILEKYPFRLLFLEDYDLGQRLRGDHQGKLCFHPSLSMPISSRRFKNGFYRTVIKYYLKTIVLMKLYERYDLPGYFVTPSEVDCLNRPMQKG